MEELRQKLRSALRRALRDLKRQELEDYAFVSAEACNALLTFISQSPGPPEKKDIDLSKLFKDPGEAWRLSELTAKVNYMVRTNMESMYGEKATEEGHDGGPA